MKIILKGTGWKTGHPSVYVSDADRILIATHPNEVIPVLDQLEQAVADGLIAVGFLGYEASAAWDMPVHTEKNTLPLAWFALLDPSNLKSRESAKENLYGQVSSSISTCLEIKEYEKLVTKIHESISQGKTYQVNFTQRMQYGSSLDHEALFDTLHENQPVEYAALIQTDDWSVISLSPELFLARQGNCLVMKPMKGTTARGRTTAEDESNRRYLIQSEKERAENLMIVDMCRNDLGAICQTGSVKVESLFEVEPYRTVNQMTSTVSGTAKPGISLTDTLRATFPAASVTGAPKISTMSIIRELEPEQREVYCGSIGVMYPSGDFVYNVAIRTLWGSGDNLTFGVGSGIVWDSVARREFDELETKAAFLMAKTKPFRLIETMLVDESGGIEWLDDHLARLADSATYFGFSLDVDHARSRILSEASALVQKPWVLRMTLSETGDLEFSNRPVLQVPDSVRVRISSTVVGSGNTFFAHKTTNRDLYTNEWASAQKDGFFDTLFINENGSITEGCITSVFALINGTWVTPPVSAGVLPGIWRKNMIREYMAEERAFSLDELIRAEQIVIGNAVCRTVHVDELIVQDRTIRFARPASK